ncbi:hypothetical protein HY733_00615 [Candidatus Uhrbacteria bacterium]|nr:hypothetical protein [Candidatus Uhrbacteria bacterium]
MSRTQILLDPQLKQALRVYSRQRQLSISELIRQVMSQHLVRSQAKQVGLAALERLARQAKKGGSRNLSQQVDDTLYPI